MITSRHSSSSSRSFCFSHSRNSSLFLSKFLSFGLVSLLLFIWIFPSQVSSLLISGRVTRLHPTAQWTFFHLENDRFPYGKSGTYNYISSTELATFDLLVMAAEHGWMVHAFLPEGQAILANKKVDYLYVDFYYPPPGSNHSSSSPSSNGHSSTSSPSSTLSGHTTSTTGKPNGHTTEKDILGKEVILGGGGKKPSDADKDEEECQDEEGKTNGEGLHYCEKKQKKVKKETSPLSAASSSSTSTTLNQKKKSTEESPAIPPQLSKVVELVKSKKSSDEKLVKEEDHNIKTKTQKEIKFDSSSEKIPEDLFTLKYKEEKNNAKAESDNEKASLHEKEQLNSHSSVTSSARQEEKDGGEVKYLEEKEQQNPQQKKKADGVNIQKKKVQPNQIASLSSSALQKKKVQPNQITSLSSSALQKKKVQPAARVSSSSSVVRNGNQPLKRSFPSYSNPSGNYNYRNNNNNNNNRFFNKRNQLPYRYGASASTGMYQKRVQQQRRQRQMGASGAFNGILSFSHEVKPFGVSDDDETVRGQQVNVVDPYAFDFMKKYKKRKKKK